MTFDARSARALSRRTHNVQDCLAAMKAAVLQVARVGGYEASVALPAYCFALLQNLSQTEQEVFARRVTLLRSASLSPRVKAYLLGLSLLNLVGEEILTTGVDNLGDEIKDAPLPTLEPIKPENE